MVSGCAECPPEEKESCRLQGGFFSEDDRALHRAIFPQAYCAALVVNVSGEDDAGGGTSVSCFGWNRGAITSRGFAMLGSRDAVAAGGLGADRPERGGREERE